MELREITMTMTDIARKAGSLIRENVGKISANGIEEKGLHDFVTQIDRRSERMIVEMLERLLPAAGFITEEHTVERVGERYNWIVDPLDGTTNFIHSLFPMAVSIALADKHDIVAGVVYEVGLDECFYAWKNGGAWLNGKSIAVSNTCDLNNAFIATGFPCHELDSLDQYLRLYEFLTKNTAGLRRLGSAATDLCYVACGRFDAYYKYNLKPWDVAAGAIIIEQAGGQNCDFKGQNNFIFGEEIISANKLIINELQNVVAKFMLHKN